MSEKPLPQRRFATIEEAAAMLGVSRNTCYTAVKKGQIPTVRIGGRNFVPLAFFEASKTAPATAAE